MTDKEDKWDGSTKHLFELAHKAKTEAQLDIPDERLNILPYVGESENGLFYEDAWLKIEVVKREKTYQMEFTGFTKSGKERIAGNKIVQLPDVKTKLDACLKLQEIVQDNWTSGALHPIFLEFSGTGFVPSYIKNIFRPFEEKYLKENIKFE